MKDENLLHVKLEYPEAVQSKRDILSSERDLIRLLKIIKTYHSLRKEELSLKLKLYTKIKELRVNLVKLHQILPKIKIPDILKKDEESPKEKLQIKNIKEYEDKDLESQLQEIQERLRKLS